MWPVARVSFLLRSPLHVNEMKEPGAVCVLVEHALGEEGGGWWFRSSCHATPLARE